MTQFYVKWIYEPASPSDGYRLLVDRVWPRGISKQVAKLDAWNKEIAPSSELRKWFHHDQARFDEFKKRYHRELKESNGVEVLKSAVKDEPTVTLLFGAHDQTYNQAVVLKDMLNA